MAFVPGIRSEEQLQGIWETLLAGLPSSGVVSKARATAAEPSYTEGTDNAISQRLDGNLRVIDEDNFTINAISSGYLSSMDSNVFSMAGYTSNLSVMVTATVLNNAFATGRGIPAMAEYDDTSTDVPTEDRVYMLRMTANRGLHVNLRNTAGTSDLGANIDSNITQLLTAAYTVGTTFDGFLASGGYVTNDPASLSYSEREAAPHTISRNGILWTVLSDTAGNEIDMSSTVSNIAILTSATNANNSALSRGSAIMAQLDDVSTGTVTENNVSTLRMTSSRGLHTNPRSATGVEVPVSQGSTTSGQFGGLAMGAVTTSAPSYTTAQTSPLSLYTNGALRVRHTDGTNSMPTGDAIGRYIYTLTGDGSGVFNLTSTVASIGGFGAQTVLYVDTSFESLDFTANGEGRNHVASTDNTKANSRYITANSEGAIAVYESGNTTTQTYSACITGLATAATATDIFTITGSGTKTIEITQVAISGTATTAITTNVKLIKRSTANSGGTSASATAVPHDSSNSAATATVLSYTANPTTGTSVGEVRSMEVFFPLATAAPTAAIYDLGVRQNQPIILRGTTQVLAVNLNSITVLGSALSIWIEWKEK